MDRLIFDSRFPMDFYKHYRFEKRYAYRQNEAGIHNHDYMEIFWVHSGKGFHLHEDREKLLREGSLGFVRPDDKHGYFGFGNTGISWINLPFQERMLRSILQQFFPNKVLTNNSEESGIYLLNPIQNEWIGQALKQVIQGKSERFILHRFLVNLLYELFGDSSDEEDSHIPNWIKKSCIQIKMAEHFVNGTEGLVALTPFSAEHVSREFKRYLGRTPTEVVNDARLDYAAERLVKSADKILDICLDCGFNNLSHFYRIFQKKFDTSPRKYRMFYQ